jgi:Uma2 family endonuclease
MPTPTDYDYRKALTPEQYLLRERAAEYKSEFYPDEGVRAMTGASRRHNLLVLNAALSLKQQLGRGACEVYAADMRVRVASTGAYVYPDLTVACEPRFEDGEFDTLLNPVVLVEVLSPSTERHDRGKKWQMYNHLETLRHYVLVSQTEMLAEWYTRQPGEIWLFAEARGEGGEVRLDSIGCTLRLAELYEGVL